MRQLATLLLFQALCAAASAQDSIQVGSPVIDPPTLCCIGLAIPIVAGDDNYNATATLEYRVAGAPSWTSGLPLLRVRPDTVGSETPPSQYGLPYPDEEFAGSIFDLAPGTDYDVRITVSDPDGGGSAQTFTTATRGLPLADPATPNVVTVGSNAELTAALASAQAGDVITLGAGTYQGPLSIAASGTQQNPIVLRGEDRDTVLVDSAGASYGLTVSGSHVYVEQLTISGSTWGARLSGGEDIVIRHNRFTSVNRGIDGRNGSHHDYYICDNVLEGVIVWPTVDNTTWDEEGIVVTGQGHVVCHNTISGFGDALGLHQNTSIPNMAIDFYGNDVLFTGDDGIELDYSHRNVRAFRNRIANSGMGISVQPGWGGPIYMLRNVLINQKSSPFKFNNDPTGLIVYHNTTVRASGPGNAGGAGWAQLGYQQGNGDWAYVANFRFVNNIVMGTSQPAKFTSGVVLGEIDNNGWYPDGTFQFFDSYANFADLQANSPYEANGQVLASQTFESPPALGADYTTFVDTPEVSLRGDSGAIDAGRILPNVNDGFAGAGPDLGAWETGRPIPEYGVRPATVTPPDPPPDSPPKPPVLLDG